MKCMLSETFCLYILVSDHLHERHSSAMSELVLLCLVDMNFSRLLSFPQNNFG